MSPPSLSDEELRDLVVEARRRGTDDGGNCPPCEIPLEALLVRLAKAIEQLQGAKPDVLLAAHVTIVRRDSLEFQTVDEARRDATLDGWLWRGHLPNGLHIEVGDEVLVGIGKVPK